MIVEEIVNKQRNYFQQTPKKSFQERKFALEGLLQAIKANEKEINHALYEDLGKSAFESYATEIGIILAEIRFTLKHLRKWMKARKVKTAFTHFGSKSFIYPEPYGVTLIIAPWNYPFQLAIGPLIGAIAAGNTAIIKPSEHAPKTAFIIKKIIESSFSPESIAVVLGGVETSNALLKEKFDYIFFTGSEDIGKIVMEACAKHLTPHTLELGGKSPCIVTRDANLKIAAKRIIWGKFLNAGQTCIAPDYLLIEEEILGPLLQLLKEEIIRFWGQDATKNQAYPKLIHQKHFQRLSEFLADGEIYYGGQIDVNNLKIAPTLLLKPKLNSAIMTEEIFGPILPIIPFTNLADEIQMINERPKPLACYLFSENKATIRGIINNISFGGGCINDTIYHIATPYLPFGGVGSSGHGAYHGFASFKTFSHEKSILKQTTKFDLPFRYHTFKNANRWIRRLLK